MTTKFANRMRELQESSGFEVEIRGRPIRFKFIAAVMVTHVFINENLKYEPFIKYLTKTLNENNIVDFSHRAKALIPQESDGVIFITLKYPHQAIKIIEIFDEKFFGDSAINGKFLTCKPNGFSNLECVPDYQTERYREQVESIKLFNERWYVRSVNTNYNWLPPARAHQVYHSRRQSNYDANHNNNFQRRSNYSNRDNSFPRTSRNEANLNETASRARNSSTVSIKAENSNDVKVSIQMRTDNNNNGKNTNKRKLPSSSSSEILAKKVDVSGNRAEPNDDNDCFVIEPLSIVDKAKHDLEEHMGSQPFDCARCGQRLIGSEVISHRCKVPPLDDNNPGFGFYS